MNAFNLLQLIILVLLALSTIYIFIFSVAGHFYRNKNTKMGAGHRRIAVLIPGYKEDEVILHVAAEALKQDYPASLFDVVVIADSFRPPTIEALKSQPIRLIEVSFEKSTKSKALNKAMEILGDHYDLAVVLDADNLMAPDFLSRINSAFEGPFMAVQGHRTAKNLNTSLAVLDAVSEEINNHLFRKGHRALGLSSAIIGSGMAFRYAFFKELMSTVHAVGGFDKEIELKMLKSGHKIAYLDDAIVFDEKVQQADAFRNQRRRWLSAQFHYFRKDFPGSLRYLFLKGNIDYFDKVIQFIQPPRILLLGAVLLFGTAFIAADLFLGQPSMAVAWAAVMLTCVVSISISIPGSYYNVRTLKAMASLPKGMVLMMMSLLRIKGANRQFIHTRHSAFDEATVKN